MNVRTSSVLFAAIFLTACGTKEREQVTPIQVETETLTENNFFHNRTYVGEVEAETSTAVSFTGSGTVQKVLVSSGQSVAKGQLLAVMDPTQCNNAIMAAEAMMMQAQDAYNRMKVLHDRKSLSDMDWVEVQSKCTQAKSNLQIAKKMLDDCSLKAPCSGIIGKKALETGQVALPSQPVCTILAINKVKVSVQIPEKEIGKISSHTPAEIYIAALNRNFIGGKIEKEIEADAVTRSYTIKINVDNTHHQLLPGMVCDVRLDFNVQNRETGIISVPITAVQRSAMGDKYVWRLKGNKAYKTNVTLGIANGNRIEITNGLTTGDKIIVKGYQKLSEGSNIVESDKK